jgi:hypothetical protein
MNVVMLFFAGAFLCNAIPHLTRINWAFAALLAGALAIGIFSSLRFGKVRQSKEK